MQHWQLQDAKNRFSQVVDHAIHDGPQIVTRRGKESVVILSLEEYRRLKGPGCSLVQFLQSSPLAGVELDLERSKETARDIEL